MSLNLSVPSVMSSCVVLKYYVSKVVNVDVNMSLKVRTENNSGSVLKDMVVWDVTLCRSSHCKKLEI
jgi:hypothetical protein